MAPTNMSSVEGETSRRMDWSHLIGDCVEIWLEELHVCTGIVDQATSDDSVLWLAADGSRTRQLFDKYAGYEVRMGKR